MSPMRRLVLRMTAVAALFAAVCAFSIGAATGVSTSVAIFRAILAAVIVALAGAGAGLVLMRTALRRYYESGRPNSGNRRVPTNR
jgi:hypothetical protein